MQSSARDCGKRPANSARTIVKEPCCGVGLVVPTGYALDMSSTPHPFKRATNVRSSKKDQGLLGLGLDGTDGHKRLTQGDDFVLMGGSEETHERMQDLVIRMNEKLKRKGKAFRDLSEREFEDLAHESLE